MDSTVLLMSLGIMAARCADVSLGTLRTVSIIQGRRAVAYAFGFGAGNYVGITLEKWFAFGEQMLSVMTRQGMNMAPMLRTQGFNVVSFGVEDANGHLQLLFIESHRKDTNNIAQLARQIDPECIYLINDVRTFSSPLMMTQQPTGWRSILKKK